ncbi:sensor histidine kinase [Janthinobacterium sp.]|uniref:sensor histidine kinase n=1 Tax=Janthinobacterium sp. TaxID=1871054 RepID=UPI00293D710E|nr:sensor histidine kinase [Janthinobacterium sp.]
MKSRLAVWVLLPTVLISIVDLAFTTRSTGRIATLVQQQLLKGSAKIIAEQLATIDGGYEISVPPAAFELLADNEHDRVFYSVRSKSGLLIAGDAELAPYTRPLQIEQEQYFLSSVRGEPVRVIAYQHALPSTISSDYAVTQVAQTLHGHTAFRDDLLRMTIREHLMLLTILIAGLAIALRWTLSPLVEFGAKILSRQPGSLERLDDRHAPAEVGPIIFAMNEYVARLDRTLNAYEQFVANTAHQLRTSFAILSSQISFGLRNPHVDPAGQDVLNAMQAAVGRANKVINQLLVLAAVEQTRHQDLPSGSTQAAAVIQGVMEELAPLAQQKHIELGIDRLDNGVYIALPLHLLRELVANLIDNAIRHMVHQGSVTVSLEQDLAGVVLRVSDTGPGIALAEREKVFQRFYRIDETRPNSSGLGLAIVREICDAMHASVTLGTGPGGIGLKVEIRFPCGPGQSPG